MTTPQDPFSTPPAGSTPPPSQPAPGYGQQSGQQGDQQGGYGQPGGFGEQGGYGTAPAQGHSNGLGTAALVLGIIAVLTSWFGLGALLGIAAIILGALGLGKVKRREASNRGSAIAGIVLGVLGLVLLAGLIAAGVGFVNSDTGKALTECIERAGQDRVAQEQCQREAEERLQG